MNLPALSSLTGPATTAAGYVLALGAWATLLATYPLGLGVAITVARGQAVQRALQVEGQAFARSFSDQLALAERREAERRAAA